MGLVWPIAVVIAVVIGVVHTAYTYRQETREFRTVLSEHPIKIRARAAYYAAWTLLLWVLLGSSIVIYWLIALLPYVISKGVRAVRSN
ncbi:MAG: hypothetical protein OEU36_22095 [Gammaproteobacteria bacterium]|nr:hypothetical protein [Gammaproteobacteria bacterium]